MEFLGKCVSKGNCLEKKSGEESRWENYVEKVELVS